MQDVSKRVSVWIIGTPAPYNKVYGGSFRSLKPLVDCLIYRFNLDSLDTERAFEFTYKSRIFTEKYWVERRGQFDLCG